MKDNKFDLAEQLSAKLLTRIQYMNKLGFDLWLGSGLYEETFEVLAFSRLLKGNTLTAIETLQEALAHPKLAGMDEDWRAMFEFYMAGMISWSKDGELSSEIVRPAEEAGELESLSVEILDDDLMIQYS